MYHMLGKNDKIAIKITLNLPNQHLEDVLKLPDHPDGDQNYWGPFLIIALVLRIPKRFHM